MEATDFAAADLEAELAARIAEVQGRRAVEIGRPAALVTGLAAVLETPLGPVLGGPAAAATSPGRDRLDELGFELPLAGGDRPSGWLTLQRIAASCAPTPAPTTRWPATPSGSTTRGCARASAAT